MYAIIRDGSRQVRVAKGDEVALDLKPSEPGKKLEFGEVLLVHDGKKAKHGTPTVAGAKVVAEVVSRTAGPKLRVHKYKRRQGYQRTLGHKQKYTLVRITDIITK
ncbi:MAG: 50S ribosomal protein L21 [Planctomycetota bacterium]|jgi:large subunit ribosomal protein L21